METYKGVDIYTTLDEVIPNVKLCAYNIIDLILKYFSYHTLNKVEIKDYKNQVVASILIYFNKLIITVTFEKDISRYGIYCTHFDLYGYFVNDKTYKDLLYIYFNLMLNFNDVLNNKYDILSYYSIMDKYTVLMTALNPLDNSSIFTDVNGFIENEKVYND